ncbi:hypothetical protein, partial [uncultured Algibacter sp.]|uniref:hypothetical protein n=1 Tax=uncultured Algibacter sp. TaxID=298659 RepID=UPI00263559A0
MYNFTQKSKSTTSLNLMACCLSLLRKSFKSITSLAVVMLFLFGNLGFSNTAPYRIDNSETVKTSYFDVTGFSKYLNNTSESFNVFTASESFAFDQLNCTHNSETLTIGDASCKNDEDIYNDAIQVVKFDRSFSGNGDNAEIIYLKTNNYACCGTALVNPKSGTACYDLRIAGPKGPNVSITEIGNINDSNCDLGELNTDCAEGPMMATVNCPHNGQHEPVSHKITFLGSTSPDNDGNVYWYYKIENKINACQAVKGISHLTFAILDDDVCCVPEATCDLEDLNYDCISVDQVEAPTNVIADVFNVTNTCGGQQSMMSSDSTPNVDNSNPLQTVITFTRTYTLYENGELVQTCDQLITITNLAPVLIDGNDLQPGDTDIDLDGCVPPSDLAITLGNNLFEDCLGNPISNENILIEIVEIDAVSDCDWTITIKVFVTTPGIPTPQLIKEETFMGGDKEKPVITQATGQPDGYDFGCNPPVPPTFTATDNCADNLVVVVTGDPTGDACNRTQTWTANVSDGCNDADPITVTYTWIEAPALVINEVGDDTDNSSCDYADQVA